jgi:hypothetical protein
VITADENEELSMRAMHLLLILVLFSYTTTPTQAQGTFTPTGNMTAARSFHTAMLLANGKVLIVGGAQSPRGSSALSTAELYDPDTGTFTPVGNLESPLGPLNILLGDGRVLLVTPKSTGNRATLYDPANGTVTESGTTATGQIGGWAILLNNGKVLIAGGTTGPQDPRPIANPELYDPSTGTFTATGAFATKGSTFYVSGGPDVSAVSLLADGKVLIAGELTSEIYDPDTGMFAQTSPMTTPCFGFGGPPLYIYGRTATLLQDGKVLLIGGEEEDCGRFANAELYDALKAKFSPSGSMMRARDNHAATLLRDGTVLITGGESQDPFGNGGWIFSGTTTSAESYDPSTGGFTSVGDMTERRAGHTATVLKDGRVLITGGYGYAGIGAYNGNFSTAEIYTPPVLVPPEAPGNFQFDRSSVVPGSSYIVNISGSNLTAESFFDIRFRIPGSTLDQVVLNWQRGTSMTHVVPVDLATGVWTVTGVRAHQTETDHTGIFFPVSATITVSNPLSPQTLVESDAAPR